MVGDRLDTDILFGKGGSVSTLLVLTGVTTQKDLANITEDRIPDFVTGSIGDLVVVGS